MAFKIALGLFAQTTAALFRLPRSVLKLINKLNSHSLLSEEESCKQVQKKDAMHDTQQAGIYTSTTSSTGSVMTSAMSLPFSSAIAETKRQSK